MYSLFFVKFSVLVIGEHVLPCFLLSGSKRTLRAPAARYKRGRQDTSRPIQDEGCLLSTPGNLRA